MSIKCDICIVFPQCKAELVTIGHCRSSERCGLKVTRLFASFWKSFLKIEIRDDLDTVFYFQTYL